jgi:hypothetical protein
MLNILVRGNGVAMLNILVYLVRSQGDLYVVPAQDNASVFVVASCTTPGACETHASSIFWPAGRCIMHLPRWRAAKRKFATKNVGRLASGLGLFHTKASFQRSTVIYRINSVQSIRCAVIDHEGDFQNQLSRSRSARAWGVLASSGQTDRVNASIDYVCRAWNVECYKNIKWQEHAERSKAALTKENQTAIQTEIRPTRRGADRTIQDKESRGNDCGS